GLEMDGTHKYVPKPSDEYAKDKPLVQAIEEKKETKDEKKDAKDAKDEKKEEKKDEKKVEEPRAKRITDFVKNNTPDLKPVLGDSQDLKNTVDDVQSFPERIYVKMVRGYRDMDQPLAFYLFLLFLVIALVSCIFRREARKTVRGRPLPMGGE
ncbi:MAG TPA: hypothetical protein VE988_13710, partial [Gemmataceae bacterium]|nr:hypothetical protein [Gemmataceae bacterium]